MTEETTRKMASIQVIEELTPIVGAEQIECARVLGWHVVVKKNEFKVGDAIIYCEIDSILPEKPEFEFLRARKFRIKTIKLKGQISQGICFPVTLLTDKGISVKVGDDVTEIIGIVKYEIPLPANLVGKVVGQFPEFLAKTDETRVQLLQKVLTRNKDIPCYVAEKLDGTSATYFIKDGVFGVCSRNLHLEDTEDNLYWQMAKKYKIEEKLRSLNKNVAIQGEIIGFGVQGNPLKLRDKYFYAFNLFDIDSFTYYDFAIFTETCRSLEIDTVPIFDKILLHDNIDELVKYATRNLIIFRKKEKKK
jgi:RNA ligase (TIGR02306 family)